MRPVKSIRDLAALFLALLLVAGLPLLGGCGGEEEPAGPETEGPTARPGDEAPATTAPAALSAMQFMPDGAQVAVGIPPVNGILSKVKDFSERYGAAGMDPQALVEEWTAGLAMELNVPGAMTMGEIASAKGVNFDAPMAAFFDFRPALDAAAAEARQEAADRAEPEVDLTELSGPRRTTPWRTGPRRWWSMCRTRNRAGWAWCSRRTWTGRARPSTRRR